MNLPDGKRGLGHAPSRIGCAAGPKRRGSKPASSRWA
jgi:hypothetical protein